MADENIDFLLSSMLDELIKKKSQPTVIKMAPGTDGEGGFDGSSLLDMLLKLFKGGKGGAPGEPVAQGSAALPPADPFSFANSAFVPGSMGATYTGDAAGQAYGAFRGLYNNSKLARQR